MKHHHYRASLAALFALALAGCGSSSSGGGFVSSATNVLTSPAVLGAGLGAVAGHTMASGTAMGGGTGAFAGALVGMAAGTAMSTGSTEMLDATRSGLSEANTQPARSPAPISGASNTGAGANMARAGMGASASGGSGMGTCTAAEAQNFRQALERAADAAMARASGMCTPARIAEWQARSVANFYRYCNLPDAAAGFDRAADDAFRTVQGSCVQPARTPSMPSNQVTRPPI